MSSTHTARASATHGSLPPERPDNTPCDLCLVAGALQVAQLPDGTDIDILAYLRVWHELSRFMRRLGFAFKFVTDDLTQKTDALAMYMRSETRAHYRTVRSMVDYERAMGTVANERPPTSGAVNLIVLNRALLFVVRLIEHLHGAPPHVKISKIAKKDYVDTLAEFHPWYIRAAVRIALRTLPTRREVVATLRGELSDAELEQAMVATTREGQRVYQRVYAIYERYQLQRIAPR